MKPLYSFFVRRGSAFAASALLLTACGPTQQSQSQTQQRQSDIAQANASPPSSPSTSQTQSKNFVFVTEPPDDGSLGTPQAEVSILKMQRGVLRLFGVQPGQMYEATWRLSEGTGRPIMTNVFRFTPDAPNYSSWWPFQPDYKVHKAGKWKWTAEVKGLGRYSTEVSVLPPPPTELKDLALHEKARESVFRAFAHYWVALTNDYFTVVPVAERVQQDQTTYSQPSAQSPSFALHSVERQHKQDMLNQLARQGSSDTRRMRELGTELDQLTRLAQQQEPAKPRIILSTMQARDVGFHFTRDFVSDADRLNGINYLGSASFGFRLYRLFIPGKGWLDWKETDRPSSEFTEALGEMVSATSIPSELQGVIRVSFRIMERDGNWFIQTEGGERFANGKPDGTAKAVPHRAPRIEFVQEIVRTGRSPDRERDQVIGLSAREDPAALERGIIATMTQLRGRTL